MTPAGTGADATRRTIVAVDGSGPADAAIDWAAVRALRTGSALLLVHVIDSEPSMGEDWQRELLRTGSSVLASAERRVRHAQPTLPVESRLLTGPLTRTLAEFATEHDLLVIGTHKTGFLHGRVLGSRSVQIAQLVRCELAVVPELDLRFRAGVVAGIAGDGETVSAIARAAARAAVALDADLLFVHADDSGPALDDPLLQRARAAAAAVAPRLRTASRVSARGATDALLDASRAARLLVLGPPKAGPTANPIGTVHHEVLLNANAPVLIAAPALVTAR